MSEHDNESELLHRCAMPCGYIAPWAFSRLLHAAAWLSRPRSRAIDSFSRLVQRTVVTCGACGARIHDELWTRASIADLCEVARSSGIKRLREVMYSDYEERQPRCPVCHHVAHLARDEPTPHDDIPF